MLTAQICQERFAIEPLDAFELELVSAGITSGQLAGAAAGVAAASAAVAPVCPVAAAAGLAAAATIEVGAVVVAIFG